MLIHRCLLIFVLLILTSCVSIPTQADAAGKDELRTISEWGMIWGDGTGSIDELIDSSTLWTCELDEKCNYKYHFGNFNDEEIQRLESLILENGIRITTGNWSDEQRRTFGTGPF